jgi:hypothetical protein
LSCDWNFRPFQCIPGSSCRHALFQGISALHGNALSFTQSGVEPLFYTVFDVFLKLEMKNEEDGNDDVIVSLLDELESRLLLIEEKRENSKSSYCSKFGGFSTLVLHKLQEKSKKNG